jgi:diadenosine tetraphosphate (Ap4A) HIT family hydrolase
VRRASPVSIRADFSDKICQVGFQLHSRLAADTEFVGDWPLCRLLLMNDARFPWLILVPRHADLVEILDLGEEDRALLMKELVRAGKALRAFPGITKLNIGTLGNLVPQLHIHVVGRHAGDPAWPGPVWGFGNPEPYAPARRDAILAAVRSR